MRFEDGKFIVEGTVGESIKKIIFHLHNINSPVFNHYKEATLEGQNFKVEFTLEDIKYDDGNAAPENSYLNVRYEINEDGFGTPLNLLPANNGGYAVGQEYRYAGKTWTLGADNSKTFIKWVANTEVYTLTKVEIIDKDGVATLIVEGTYTGEVEYSNLQLKMDKTSDTKQEKYVENTATEAGQFKFEVAINELLTSTTTENSKEEGYFLRLWNKDTSAKIADINSRWASDKLFDKVEIGEYVYYFYRNSLTAWNTLGVVRFEKSALEG